MHFVSPLLRKLFTLLALCVGANLAPAAVPRPADLDADKLSQALDLLKSGARAEAEPLIDAAVGEDTTSLSAAILEPHLRGLLAMKHGDYGTAADDFNAAIAADPKFKDAWIQLLECRRQQDDKQAYLKVTDRYYAQFPDSEEVRLFCGKSWMQTGAWERLKPLRAYYAAQGGNGPLGDGELQARSRPFQTLIKLENLVRQAPDNAERQFELGNLMCLYQNFDEGVPHMEKADSLKPNELRIIFTLVRACASGKVYPELGLRKVDQAQSLLVTASMPSEDVRQRLQKELDAATATLMQVEADAAGTQDPAPGSAR